MKYLSVCSGIEAATVAWEPLGWEAAAYSEIEAFPSKVLKHHYPKVQNLGDMTKFEEWELGTIDLLVGGTPCQSFSVAGLRKGLDDPRGNLMLTYGAIAKRFKPKWLVWENVPGVLSSNNGRDFATFLGMLAELGYGFAYRILDAQYFGVAQRRRRVFVVGCIGDWRSAAAVLFERSSLSGNPAPSREARKRTAPGAQPSPAYGGSNSECADTVTSKWSKGSGGPSGNEGGLFVAHTLRAKHNAGEDGTGRGTPLVPVEVPEVMSTLLSSTAGISRPGNAVTEHETYIPMVFGVGEKPDVGHCLRSQASKADKHESTTYVAQPVPFRKSKRAQTEDDDETWTDDQVANTINVFDQGDIRTTHAVVQPIVLMDQGGSSMDVRSDGLVGTLRRETHGHEPLVMQPIPLDLRNSNRDPEKHDEMNRQGVGIGEEGDPSHTLTSACVHGVAQPVNIYGGNKRKDRPEGGFYVRMDEQTSKTLDAASGLNPTAAQGGTAVIQPIAWDEDLNARENVMGTLIHGPQGGRRSGVAHPITFSSVQSAQDINPRSTVSQTLEAKNPMAVVAPSLTATNDPSRSPQSSEVTQQVNAVYQASMAVRRLTPVECERLQGFPDDYTRIPWRKGETPDGPRYKALGNSMAVPVMAWIGQRIQAVNDLPK